MAAKLRKRFGSDVKFPIQRNNGPRRKNEAKADKNTSKDNFTGSLRKNRPKSLYNRRNKLKVERSRREAADDQGSWWSGHTWDQIDL